MLLAIHSLLSPLSGPGHVHTYTFTTSHPYEIIELLSLWYSHVKYTYFDSILYKINNVISFIFFFSLYSATSGANGIFSRRLDFSSFNVLPKQRINSYSIKVCTHTQWHICNDISGIVRCVMLLGRRIILNFQRI